MSTARGHHKGAVHYQLVIRIVVLDDPLDDDAGRRLHDRRQKRFDVGRPSDDVIDGTEVVEPNLGHHSVGKVKSRCNDTISLRYGSCQLK